MMVVIVAEQYDLHSDIYAHIVKLINSVGLLNEAKSLHAQLQSVANALDRLQFDNATIADACEEWLSLLWADALKPHLTTVMKCFRKQLLITTSSQICYIWNTKENICLKLMKKLYDSCFRSFIQKLL